MPLPAPQELRTYFVTAVTANRRRLFQVETTADLLLKTISDYRDQGRFQLHAFIVMPDHLHALLTPAPDVSLEKAMQYIKGGFSFRLRASSTSGREASTNRKSSPSKNSTPAKSTSSKTPSAPTSANHPKTTNTLPYPTAGSSTLAHTTSSKTTYVIRAHPPRSAMLPATRVKLEPEGEGSWRLWPLTTCEARHRPKLDPEGSGCLASHPFTLSILLTTCEARHRAKLDPEGAGAFRPLKSVSPESRGASAPGPCNCLASHPFTLSILLTTCEARHRAKLDPEGAGAFRPLKSVSPENRGASAPGFFPPMRPRSAAPTYLISTTFRTLSKVSASTARTLLR